MGNEIIFIVEIVCIVLVAILMIQNIILGRRLKKNKAEFDESRRVKAGLDFEQTKVIENLTVKLENLSDSMRTGLSRQREDTTKTLDIVAKNLIESSRAQSEMQKERLDVLERTMLTTIRGVDVRSENLRKSVEENLKAMNEQNRIALEKMRGVVDEKLSTTLESRLSKSFEVINKSLSEVNKGLGDMQSLAKEVGGLKDTFKNVKLRGTWAEMQLHTLLSEMLAPNQYIKNCQVKKNSQERVDFAIRMPGHGDEVLLPIDSKFPIEDYQSLVSASQKADVDGVALAIKQLERRVKDEAKSISSKYIVVPKTTDFAILYLPLEGLYAEVVKMDGLCELLQRQYRIIVCGPNTIAAFLSSLQMGFKTVAIEKKTSEVHDLLRTFRKEFNSFIVLLERTQKKIDEASRTIDSATKKTKTITRKLDKVEDIEIDNNIGGAFLE